MDDASQLMRSLLSESLIMWRAEEATIDLELPSTVTIDYRNEIQVRVEQASRIEHPVRWWVRWKNPDTGRLRSQPCISTVGVLRAVRNVFEVEGGLRLRINLAAESS